MDGRSRRSALDRKRVLQNLLQITCPYRHHFDITHSCTSVEINCSSLQKVLRKRTYARYITLLKRAFRKQDDVQMICPQNSVYGSTTPPQVSPQRAFNLLFTLLKNVTMRSSRGVAQLCLISLGEERCVP